MSINWKRINFGAAAAAMLIGAVAGLDTASKLPHATVAVVATGAATGAGIALAGWALPNQHGAISALAGRFLPGPLGDIALRVLGEQDAAPNPPALVVADQADVNIGTQVAPTSATSAAVSASPPAAVPTPPPAAPAPDPNALKTLLAVAEQVGLSHLVKQA